ncbi:hypothetical protein A2J03_24235 [Rhodococcus sp. EPR-157]|uniref:hypothetical protein n=1 Tax=Rhodococcus sp. EPR-157 TaxID=1813677 RepID=UPI0007BB8F16|nr:hypothetical protein [Rhodococcus sp. EPR-157]KZF06612.1 hypothetical protein A2J03_24235 [Rhodococcus sp. EPR-157]
MADDENTSLNPLATLAKQSQETAKGYQDTADKLRAKAGGWGSAIQALGLAAVAWIGFDELVDVFPTHDVGWLLALLIIIGIALMAASAIFVGWNLSVQNRPLAMSSNIQDMIDNKEITEAEADRVRDVYHQFAKLNKLDFDDKPVLIGVENEAPDALKERRKDANEAVSNALASYFAPASLYESNVEKAYSYDPVANVITAPTDDEELKKLNFGLARAAQIRADLQLTRARASVVVIRDRVSNATIGRRPLAAISVFGASLIAVWFLSDGIRAYNASESDKFAIAKSCGEAFKALSDAGAKFELPEDCDAATSQGGAEGSELAIASLVALSADFSTCRANAVVKDEDVVNVEKTNENLKSCIPIRAAIDEQLKLIE